jgi:hypothetical protein
MPVLGFDVAAVGSRIRDFLFQRVGEIKASPDALDIVIVIQGTTRMVGNIGAQILNISNRGAFASEQPDRFRPAEGGYIVPLNIRRAVYHDLKLIPLLQYWAVLWSGRDHEVSYADEI